MSQAVSIALEAVCLDSIAQFTLNDPKLTLDQCEQVLALLVEQQQKRLDPYEECIRMAYIESRQVVEDLQLGQMSPALKQMMDQFGRLPHSIAYEAERAACDRIFAIVFQEARTPHHEVAAARGLMREMRKLVEDAKGGGPVIILLRVPALQALREAATRAKANPAGVLLLTVLRRYELAHGKQPESLDEAVADTVLKTVPIGISDRSGITNLRKSPLSDAPKPASHTRFGRHRPRRREPPNLIRGSGSGQRFPLVFHAHSQEAVPFPRVLRLLASGTVASASS